MVYIAHSVHVSIFTAKHEDMALYLRKSLEILIALASVLIIFILIKHFLNTVKQL